MNLIQIQLELKLVQNDEILHKSNKDPELFTVIICTLDAPPPLPSPLLLIPQGHMGA
jgi:hypothetical protein